jgi:CBS domain-containing protein
MKNSLAVRISDFLKNHPPFDCIPVEELHEISFQCTVVYLEKGKYIFKIGDQPHSMFYMVKEGAIGLSISSDVDEKLIDICGEGDILGLRPFFAKNNYLMNAHAREESLLYGIPIHQFRPYVSKYQTVLDFLLESFASNTRNPLDKNNKGKLISENVIYDLQTAEIQLFQPIGYTKNPITSSPDASIESIAKIMSSMKIGSMILVEENKPVGIITDKDLTSKIATGLYPLHTSARTLMSAPVITVPEHISVSETQLIMLKNHVGHLCITKDGSSSTSVIGIISEHDVVLSQANNPSVMMKQIKRANETYQLKEIRSKLTDFIQKSLQQNIPIEHLINLTSEINKEIVKRIIYLKIQEMEAPPPTDFAWLNTGSQGRKEQLLLTDQDHALIFADVDEHQYEEVKDYFLKLAKSVSTSLHEVGFEYCPAEMMAQNPLWCKSLTEWKQQYHQWIMSPGEKGILMCSIFFDYDHIYGNELLTGQITDYIHEITRGNQVFFAYMGSDALKNPPPLGFFRQFLLETDGDHKDNFDIKTRALMPIIDAARVISLYLQIKNVTNTNQRFKKLAEIEPQNADIYEACSEAFLLLLKFRTQFGLRDNSSGRFLNLNELSKSDKVKLKNAFKPIHDIQEVIKNRFQLTYFT